MKGSPVRVRASALPEAAANSGFSIARRGTKKRKGQRRGNIASQEPRARPAREEKASRGEPENVASQRVLEKIGMTRLGLTDRYYGTVSVFFAATARPSG